MVRFGVAEGAIEEQDFGDVAVEEAGDARRIGIIRVEAGADGELVDRERRRLARRGVPCGLPSMVSVTLSAFATTSMM